MKILSISDIELGFLYSPQVATRFGDVDLILSCGDLPYFYLEYILSMLNVPLYYVRGNHANRIEVGVDGQRHFPWGAMDVHRRQIVCKGLLIAGLEGCLRYNSGPVQYTQDEYWGMVFSMVPGLLLNRMRYGRYLDVFISHAPPTGIHDQSDRAHQGIQAFRWLLDVFHPSVHFHGHTHIYRSGGISETQYRNTRVINTFGYRETELSPGLLPISGKPTIYHQG
ncbi:MAG: metallophosphoesterase [Anaerolineaceae bacterium]|nr:metallophosphoesterase [Anaerolineaceae bacterium]